jgi:hypothetical protein
MQSLTRVVLIDIVHSHAQFFEHNGMDAVLGVGASKYYQNHLYMVEIIGILCSDRIVS